MHRRGFMGTAIGTLAACGLPFVAKPARGFNRLGRPTNRLRNIADMFDASQETLMKYRLILVLEDGSYLAAPACTEVKLQRPGSMVFLFENIYLTRAIKFRHYIVVSEKNNIVGIGKPTYNDFRAKDTLRLDFTINADFNYDEQMNYYL